MRFLLYLSLQPNAMRTRETDHILCCLRIMTKVLLTELLGRISWKTGIDVKSAKSNFGCRIYRRWLENRAENGKYKAVRWDWQWNLLEQHARAQGANVPHTYSAKDCQTHFKQHGFQEDFWSSEYYGFWIKTYKNFSNIHFYIRRFLKICKKICNALDGFLITLTQTGSQRNWSKY